MISLPQPPWTRLGRKLESACRKAIFDFNLLENPGPLALALSGGKDSLSLLFLLKSILGRGCPDRPLIAITVSGAFSCGAGLSQGFLEKTCSELNVPLITRHSDQKLETLECYSCSRNRRRLLFDAAKKEGATTIAFGHHKDDLIETLLLNLFYKGEFAGLLPKTPMHRFGVTLIRPLIYCTETDILEFAKLHGFARVTCQCPVGQTSKRRKTKELIEHIETLYPDVRQNLARASLLYGSQKAASP